MPIESLLKQLERDLTPPSVAKEHIWKRIKRSLAEPEAFSLAHGALNPEDAVKERVWARILQQIDTARSVAILDLLRGLLTPPVDLGLHLRRCLIPLCAPATPVTHRAFKWVAAFVLFALFMKAGPQLLIAPRTVAEGAVTLMPTRGEVAISVGGLWQPVNDEIVLEPGTLLRTHQGEASILLRDDGVIRLDSWTTVELHDTSDPAEADYSTEATLTLFTGRIWVQGLIPAPLKGIDVKTTHGFISVQEGSVSVAEDSDVDVKVWDRRARVDYKGNDVHLVAGERTRLSEGDALLVKKIPGEQYEDFWVNQNFRRDAVHRRYIAQLQQERRATRAGILPTSILYPAKRIAETVDVLLTFGEEAKTQKRLEHASARLDEAAALLAEGEVEAMIIPLEDYRDSLLAVATGSGNEIILSLIEQSLAEAAGEIAAVLPDDEAYLIKQAVLEASAALPDGTVSAADVQGVLLIDTVSALLQKIDAGDTDHLNDIWDDLRQHLAVLDDEQSGLRPEVRKEAKVLLSEFAFAVSDLHKKTGTVDPDMLAQVMEYLPPESEAVPVLSEEEVMAIVKSIRGRVFVFHMQRSRINQLIAEFRALEGHPDQGRILRRLYFILPDGPEHLPLRVRKEIIRLQWARAAS